MGRRRREELVAGASGLGEGRPDQPRVLAAARTLDAICTSTDFGGKDVRDRPAKDGGEREEAMRRERRRRQGRGEEQRTDRRERRDERRERNRGDDRIRGVRIEREEEQTRREHTHGWIR